MEHCTHCGCAADPYCTSCPRCKHNLSASRELRRRVQCICGTPRVSNDKHCFKCGVAYPPDQTGLLKTE